MEWDHPEPTPIGENAPAPIEQPAAPAEGTIPPMHLAWPDHTIPAEAKPPRVRPGGRSDDAIHLDEYEDVDEDDDAYMGRPRWVLVVAMVLLVTFIGWALVNVTSRI